MNGMCYATEEEGEILQDACTKFSGTPHFVLIQAYPISTATLYFQEPRGVPWGGRDRDIFH